MVSEPDRSYSTEPGQSRGSGGIRLWVIVRSAVWLLGLALFAWSVLADGIVADVTVAPGQRPEVIATQNGLPQVNITAPESGWDIAQPIPVVRCRRQRGHPQQLGGDHRHPDGLDDPKQPQPQPQCFPGEGHPQ